MKIRIKGNSVRFRLTKTEVDTFCKTGLFEEQTDFGETLFKYRLKAIPQEELLNISFKDVTLPELEKRNISFENNTITLYANEKEVKGWHKSSRISFEYSVKKNKSTAMLLLLEKDFVCMDATVEDQSDNYPNPKDAIA